MFGKQRSSPQDSTDHFDFISIFLKHTNLSYSLDISHLNNQMSNKENMGIVGRVITSQGCPCLNFQIFVNMLFWMSKEDFKDVISITDLEIGTLPQNIQMGSNNHMIFSKKQITFSFASRREEENEGTQCTVAGSEMERSTYKNGREMFRSAEQLQTDRLLGNIDLGLTTASNWKT